MSQSSSIHDLPKDNLRNPEEARIVQSMLNENVEEMNSQGFIPQQQDYIQDQSRAVDVMPDYQQPRMPPGAMGGAQPMMQQPMPQQVPQVPMEQFQQQQQQQMFHQQQQQQQMQQAMKSAAQEVGVPNQVLENESLFNWLLFESKEPLIVAGLYFVLSMAFIRQILAGYVPYLSNSFLNLLFRALLMGVLVYVLKKFI
jgi:hypothetical protein